MKILEVLAHFLGLFALRHQGRRCFHVVGYHHLVLWHHQVLMEFQISLLHLLAHQYPTTYMNSAQVTVHTSVQPKTLNPI